MDTVVKEKVGKRLSIGGVLHLASERKIVALTSYTANIARISEKS